MERQLTINRLPSKTWNWLRVNESVVPWAPSGAVCRVRGADGKETGRLDEIKTGAGEGADCLFAGQPADRIACGAGACPHPALVRISSEGEGACAGALEVHGGADSRITVTENFLGAENRRVSLAFRTRIKAERNARVRLIQLLFTGQRETLLNDVGAECEEGASVEVIQLILGDGTVYDGCRADLTGRASTFQAQLGYLEKGRQLLDINLIVNHLGRDTVSNIRSDGTLRDSAKKIFRGTIAFHRGSAGSVGQEQENVLALGEDIVNQTVPLILCAEEAVKGTHGATLGRMEESALFYFATRGVDREAAENAVASAKLERLCAQMGDAAAERIAGEKRQEVMTNAGQ